MLISRCTHRAAGFGAALCAMGFPRSVGRRLAMRRLQRQRAMAQKSRLSSWPGRLAPASSDGLSDLVAPHFTQVPRMSPWAPENTLNALPPQ
jgi:hypothetical protein